MISFSDGHSLNSLHAGMIARLSGELFTVRDKSMQRFVADIAQNGVAPLDVKDSLVFFAAPTPGFVNGTASLGPTTSWRLGSFVPLLLDLGALGFVGKGYFPEGIPEQIKRKHSVYFQALGGAGAYYGARISEPEPLLYEELGPEAIFRIEVKDFPVIVSIDTRGAIFT